MLRWALVALLFAAALPCTAGEDACERKVPASLRIVLHAKYADFRLPQVADQADEDTAYNKSRGGDGCVAVTAGDFDGDGAQDIALLLPPVNSKRPRLVAALQRGSSWAVYVLPLWCESMTACYVETAKPGSYRRSGSLDGTPLHPDERDRVESRTESVISGTTDATGVVYVYSTGNWHYVWVSD